MWLMGIHFHTLTPEPLGAQLWVLQFIFFFFSSVAMMLTSVSYMVLKPRSPSPPPAMNAMLCDKEARRCWMVSLPSFFWSRLSPSLFTAYAVIANGQVECPKGFKRMNLTHCQGELQYMFKNTSAGINPPYIFMGDLVKKNKTSIRYSPMNIIKKNWQAMCFQAYMDPWRDSIKVFLSVCLAPMGTRSRLQLALVPGQSSAANKQLELLF